MKQKHIFGLIFGVVLSMVMGWTQATQLTASELTTKIIQTADENSTARESLVQRYYTIDDLYTRTKKLFPDHPQLARLELLKTNLRNEIDKRKNAISQQAITTFFTSYQSYLSDTTGLSNLCKNQYVIADDWAYALDIPTALILATWDMESSCGRYKPSNGDGVFQIVAKDYGSADNLTQGEWIMMMYDYAQFIKDKIARYHTSNNLSSETCSTKDMTISGQIAPICLSYTTLDMDSIIKYGALYNGLSGSTVKGNIQPANTSYVFGKFGSENQSANKDGIIMRMLKVLDYMK